MQTNNVSQDTVINRPVDREQVLRVRSFSRIVSQRIGALNDRFLKRKRSLGESRLLYEIGRKGADVRELRERLDLDSGYASRLLRSLEEQGLVETAYSDVDSRMVRATLTRKGRAEVSELDHRSNDLATSILAPLTQSQRDRLVQAMAEVEKLIRASAVDITRETPRSVHARFCLSEYFRELEDRFEAGFDVASSISAKPEELVPPAGLFVVARLNGRPIGCGALKVKSRKVGEIKRMWVSRETRGLGVGRRLLETLESYARQLGVKLLRLETNRNLKEAQSLYRSAGYNEVEAFNDEPYAHHWFERKL
jgi:DNA-binding MarR family transcriptional regulator/GNAT superfamily N-acetyltransferase